jgi:hypothetical protein
MEGFARKKDVSPARHEIYVELRRYAVFRKRQSIVQSPIRPSCKACC